MLKSSYFFTFFLFFNLFSFISLLSSDSSDKQIISTQSGNLMVTSGQTRNINNSDTSLTQSEEEKKYGESSLPANSMKSNSQEQAKEDGLYDNGILGSGFIARSLGAQKREKILEFTRKNNHQAEFQSQADSKMLELLKKRADLYIYYKDVIEGHKKVPQGTLGFTKLSEITLQEEHPESNCTLDEYCGYLVYNTINEEIKSLQGYNYYPSTISFKPASTIKFKPVVSKVSSTEESEHCPFSVRVALHQLRQKVENPSLNEKPRVNFVLREYIKKYEQGIEVLFTDGCKSHLLYNKDSNRITYTPYGHTN